jgi:23S rRNA (adenine1618-N6)-methyltransferase
MTLQPKKEHPQEKLNLHPRNKHRGRYPLKDLCASYPALLAYVHVNEFEDESIDFSNPKAVTMLNAALLKHYYEIDFWQIPTGYLCPPIPGRADYLHHMADLLGSYLNGNIPKGPQIKCLDIGVGANCVYPIIGQREYGWSFVGSDIDPIALKSAEKIVKNNINLKDKISLRLQSKEDAIFMGLFEHNEKFDLSICNPPFHASMEEASAGNLRKLSNLKQQRVNKIKLNFGGQSQELCCKGGEVQFIKSMILQSKQYANRCLWFSSLVSKSEHLESIYMNLEKAGVKQVKTIPMSTGNKITRIVAWSFLDKESEKLWVSNWKN